MISLDPEIPPQPSDNEVAGLENLLRIAAGWQSAEMILTGLGIVPNETNKRRLRATASESKWIIRGFHGYKHLQQATPEEVKHFVAQMNSQGRKMSACADAIETNYRKIYQVT